MTAIHSEHDVELRPKGEAKKSTASGLTFERYFTKNNQDPYADITWTKRDIVIKSKDGIVFEQRDVEAPSTWSDNAVTIVASKYFRGQGTPDVETGLKQVIERVVRQTCEWALDGKYFLTAVGLCNFADELRYILVHQMAAFNSPVWFNLGWASRKQASSACYINSVSDSMDSILDLVKTEGMLFKDGSGSGINLSTLRSKNEVLSAGGKSSGPVSFMRGYDAFAGVIKSGGGTRRAACMRVLNADHPDIFEFVDCKVAAEKMAHALIDAGFSGEFNAIDSVYASLPFQNANHSVRVTDEFMKAVETDELWDLRAVTTGETVDRVHASDIFDRIVEAAHFCGDPGLQFDTTTNAWHTCQETGRINASNPCSEFVFLDNTACNLASLNLMKFLDKDGDFDGRMFARACQTIILAQEIFVGFSDYPTPLITQMSRDFRPLGIGFSNLGALLMHHGLAYDSDEGRALAASISSLMSAASYDMSGMVAASCGGPFAGFDQNVRSTLNVLNMHSNANAKIETRKPETKKLISMAATFWNAAFTYADDCNGVRNAQISVLAPTGTISFMMDCDTTGIEPDIALVKWKKLVGGGTMKMVNSGVEEALRRLDYNSTARAVILDYIERESTIEGCPELNPVDLPIFDCAIAAREDGRVIAPMGHVRMMAACQPFISGAISKTVNMPNAATKEDIEDIYVQAWKLGLKAIAIYRDGCKRSQPMNTKVDAHSSAKVKSVTDAVVQVETPVPPPARRKLPNTRNSITHRFSIAGVDGYVTVGLYDDGTPGEMFISISKEGSTISGLMDAFATSISIGLQYGVPLGVLIEKFQYSRFEPAGFTGNPDVPSATSIVDYIFRWLRVVFPEGVSMKPMTRPASVEMKGLSEANPSTSRLAPDAPTCRTCGSITVRSGSCNACPACGTTSGCS